MERDIREAAGRALALEGSKEGCLKLVDWLEADLQRLAQRLVDAEERLRQRKAGKMLKRTPSAKRRGGLESRSRNAEAVAWAKWRARELFYDAWRSGEFGPATKTYAANPDLHEWIFRSLQAQMPPNLRANYSASSATKIEKYLRGYSPEDGPPRGVWFFQNKRGAHLFRDDPAIE